MLTFRKNRKEGLEFSWILFGMNLLPNQRMTTMQLKEQETSMLDGKILKTYLEIQLICDW
jgi:hypothetical protein